jgi:uncharacterized membrane protein
MREEPGRRGLVAAVALAGLLAGAGVLHLVRPAFYAPIVPPLLGDPYSWVYASGVAELACALALLPRRTRPAAAWASAALFVVVFPANIQMAIDARDGSVTAQSIAYARLPLQLPLICWAVTVARAAAKVDAVS